MVDHNEDRIVDGFLFQTTEDAKIARLEKKKVEYLQQHMDYGHRENILKIYERAIAERIFVTPIGYQFLKELQERLLTDDKIDGNDVPLLPLYNHYTKRTGSSIRYKQTASRTKIEKKPQWPMFSVIANIILVIAIATMFLITLKSDNPNILNYETSLQNKYASWEQELDKREAVIKEKELHLSNE